MKKLEDHRESNDVSNEYDFQAFGTNLGSGENQIYKSIDLNDRQKTSKRNISACTTTSRNNISRWIGK